MKEKTKIIQKHMGGGGGFVYFVAFIGALVYFIQTANSFWEGVVGILKALIWPALLVYSLLTFFHL